MCIRDILKCITYLHGENVVTMDDIMDDIVHKMYHQAHLASHQNTFHEHHYIFNTGSNIYVFKHGYSVTVRQHSFLHTITFFCNGHTFEPVDKQLL